MKDLDANMDIKYELDQLNTMYESNFSPYNLQRHMDVRHINQYVNDTRFIGLVPGSPEFAAKYDEIGDALSRKKVSPSYSNDRYVGFITKDGRYLKYDRKTLDTVVYDHKYTISLHKKSKSYYDKTLKYSFGREMPYNA